MKGMRMLFRGAIPHCRKLAGLLPRVLSIALILGVPTLFACSGGPPEEVARDGEETFVRIDSIGFEAFEDRVPAGMSAELAAETGEAGIESGIHRDTEVYRSGQSSVRIQGADSTTHWHSLQADIPDDVHCVAARLWVRGEGLRATGSQYDNTYAGFRYEGLIGDNSYAIAEIPNGSFDWTEITVFLNADAQLASNVRFVIFSSVSGTLWVDDLTFLYDAECEDMEPEALEGPLAEYIGTLHRPTTFKDMASPPDEGCPDSITAEETLEDVDMLAYILENGYSGYHYWMGRGVDFDAVFDSVRALADDDGMVALADIESTIAAGLSDIQDGHLRMTGHAAHGFLQRKCAYFADVIVEPADEAGFDDRPVYVVGQSLAEDVEPGMVYVGPEDRLFPILSREGTQQYQLGVLSKEYATRAPFSFLAARGSEMTAALMLPLHECRLTQAESWTGPVFSTAEVDGVDLVRVRSFGFHHDSLLREFVQSGQELADSDRLVVDITGNGGGNSEYPRDFVSGLNGGMAQWRLYYADLCSPATVGAAAAIPLTEGMAEPRAEYIELMRQTLERLRETPVRNWLNVTQEVPPRRTGAFKGRVVLLTDRGVASSGEAFIDYARSIPQAVTVGENSAGIGTFGDVLQYWLPNSRIRLQVPHKIFLMPGFQEGVGFTPDYWLDSSNPVPELVEWMNKPETYRFELEEAGPPELHDLDFEEFEDGIPLHIQSTIGAGSGPSARTSEITRDTSVKVLGEASLRLRGDVDTHRWQALYQDIPRTFGRIRVDYEVRAENVRREANQFDNCYVGFMYTDSAGSRQFLTNAYEGSFDWRTDSLTINIEELGASNVQFMIFLSMSGTFWVDEVRFFELPQ